MGRLPRLIAPDHFGVLLALLLLLFVSLPLLGDLRFGAVLIATLATVVLALTFVASGIERGWALAIVGVGGVAVMLIAGDTLRSGSTNDALASALVTGLLAATPVLVLRRILGHERVTGSTVAGALCAYLLIGFTFASAYRTIAETDADAFTVELGSEANYFSFVTLTTLGYGDISPVSEVARSFATLEAVLGQVVLVTLVARFVGLLGEVRPAAARRRGSGEQPDDEGPSRR
jgi:hypothetical protein